MAQDESGAQDEGRKVPDETVKPATETVKGRVPSFAEGGPPDYDPNATNDGAMGGGGAGGAGGVTGGASGRSN